MGKNILEVSGILAVNGAEKQVNLFVDKLSQHGPKMDSKLEIDAEKLVSGKGFEREWLATTSFSGIDAKSLAYEIEELMTSLVEDEGYETIKDIKVYLFYKKTSKITGEQVTIGAEVALDYYDEETGVFGCQISGADVDYIED